MAQGMARTGIAGWAIPAALAETFAGGGTHLVRYGRRLDIAEINSSFYRPHRRATYARWATSVPSHFRFAIKLPRTITHERRLLDCGDLLRAFAEEIAGLGERRGPLLVQLPPRFEYPGGAAEDFFTILHETIGGPIVCEPRHASWFTDAVDATLSRQRVARVAADPARVPAAADPGGWRGLAYFRLHGAPRIYWSAYEADAIDRHTERAAALTRDGVEVWTVFDNTASGAALANAIELQAKLPQAATLRRDAA